MECDGCVVSSRAPCRECRLDYGTDLLRCTTHFTLMAEIRIPRGKLTGKLRNIQRLSLLGLDESGAPIGACGCPHTLEIAIRTRMKRIRPLRNHRRLIT